MQEVVLRKWHRRIALVFALFLMVQTLSGFLLDATWFKFPHDFIGRMGPIAGLKWDNLDIYWQTTILYSHKVHLGGLIPGIIYRGILALGIIFTSLSGLLVYNELRKRQKKDDEARRKKVKIEA
jgi:uncharacterized iron-regulated membrane protein